MERWHASKQPSASSQARGNGRLYLSSITAPRPLARSQTLRERLLEGQDRKRVVRDGCAHELAVVARHRPVVVVVFAVVIIIAAAPAVAIASAGMRDALPSLGGDS